jgi:hypothetical protein
MAVIPDDEILRRLRKLYTDAFHISTEPADADVLRWAESPELWAEHEIRHRGKSFHVAEAVVRNCRIMRSRARRAVEAAGAHRLDGTDPFDALVPTEPTTCNGACDVQL